MVYLHKWSPISYRSSVGHGKGPTFYHCATQPVGNDPLIVEFCRDLCQRPDFDWYRASRGLSAYISLLSYNVLELSPVHTSNNVFVACCCECDIVAGVDGALQRLLWTFVMQTRLELTLFSGQMARGRCAINCRRYSELLGPPDCGWPCVWISLSFIVTRERLTDMIQLSVLCRDDVY